MGSTSGENVAEGETEIIVSNGRAVALPLDGEEGGTAKNLPSQADDLPLSHRPLGGAIVTDCVAVFQFSEISDVSQKYLIITPYIRHWNRDSSIGKSNLVSRFHIFV
jgi:hypothetical protein